VHGSDADGRHREYGPFDIQQGLQHIMRTSTQGYRPERGDHIREAELCATCRTLITTARGPGGKPIGALPEQMPYPEWLHSNYRNKQSCQDCHIPAILGSVQISHVLGEQLRIFCRLKPGRVTTGLLSGLRYLKDIVYCPTVLISRLLTLTSRWSAMR
jgi:hypothetical protein